MESSQYSYEAPGPSYEGGDSDDDRRRSGYEASDDPAAGSPGRPRSAGARELPPRPSGPGPGRPRASPPSPGLSGGPALPLLPGSRRLRRLSGPTGGWSAHPRALPLPVPLRTAWRRSPGGASHPHRRTWVWVVVLTALVAALVGGLVGRGVGAEKPADHRQAVLPQPQRAGPSPGRPGSAGQGGAGRGVHQQPVGWRLGRPGTSSRRPAPA